MKKREEKKNLHPKAKFVKDEKNSDNKLLYIQSVL